MSDPIEIPPESESLPLSTTSSPFFETKQPSDLAEFLEYSRQYSRPHGNQRPATLATVPTMEVPDITPDISYVCANPKGFGGFSDVYAALGVGGMPVAVKVLRFVGDVDEQTRKRLHKEISLWGRMSHPNIQRLLGICYRSPGSVPSMVSEWQNNGDITAYLKKMAKHNDIQEIKYHLLSDVLAGVSYLHDIHVVHGDIKGANILISGVGCALLSDFGFSIVLTEHSRSHSQQSAAQGTTRWMAPEFFADDEIVPKHTKASDIWALGCLIFEVQTGDVPYSLYRTEPLVIIAIAQNVLPSKGPFRPYGLWEIALQCFQEEPEARPSAVHVKLELINLWATISTNTLCFQPSSAPAVGRTLVQPGRGPPRVTTRRKEPPMPPYVRGAPLISATRRI